MTKRIFDVSVSAIALVILLPVMLLISVAVFIQMGLPVFFRQERPGLGSKAFEMIKFRTMLNAGVAQGAALPDDKRLTRFGKFLRSTSLDELPELICVLRGDMSLVGPRPLLTSYLPLYSPEQARRHEVRPGVTGLAQVNGRNALSWEEKFKLDVWYVDHQSFALDINILVKTFLTVFFRHGISSEGHATMPVFLGTKKTEQGTKC